MGGKDDRKQVSLSVFSEGLHSVDSYLVGGRFIFFHQALFTLPASSSIIVQGSV